MHDIHEQIEHAAHEGHDQPGSGRLPQFIGITIAILGVIMALCSAQVGAARTELITTMVEESAAKAKATAVANKYRNLQAQLQQLHAAMPDLEYQKAKNAELKAVQDGTRNPETHTMIRASQLHADKILNTVTPTEKDVQRFLGLIHRTRDENERAQHWAESYHDAVKVYGKTSDRFELATLAAEIAIVIASVGLLLARHKYFGRVAWLTAIVLGLLSVSVGMATKMATADALHAAEEKIHVTKHHFAELNKDEDDIAEDKKLEKEIVEEFEAMKKMHGIHESPPSPGKH